MVNKRKHRDLISFGVLLIILLLINIGSQFKFFRLDLTSDKRYSIAESTISAVENMDKPLIVKVYLHGEFPAKFSKLENAVKETLDEFKAYNGGIYYEFIDPNAAPTDSIRNVNFKTIMRNGLQPISLKALVMLRWKLHYLPRPSYGVMKKNGAS